MTPCVRKVWGSSDVGQLGQRDYETVVRKLVTKAGHVIPTLSHFGIAAAPSNYQQTTRQTPYPG